MLMKSFTSGLNLVLLSFGMLGVLGCGPENEAEIRAQEGKSSESQVKNPTKPVTDQRQNLQQQGNPYNKASGYPGAKK